MPPITAAVRDDAHYASRPIEPYRPRAAEHTVLHRIVREHLATFLAVAEGAGGVPTFVEREFRQFLQCGVWARGFARFRCDTCHAERLVPFSCKARAVCPSCGGRRMAERAAHLVDHVLPAVPMRQWVLSLPFRLRYLLAWNHELCREVLAVYARALRGFYRRRARRAGITDAETGAVTAIQRFGSGLNLNVHFHTLVLDGAFARDGDDWRFVPASPADRARARAAHRDDRRARRAPPRAPRSLASRVRWGRARSARRRRAGACRALRCIGRRPQRTRTRAERARRADRQRPGRVHAEARGAVARAPRELRPSRGADGARRRSRGPRALVPLPSAPPARTRSDRACCRWPFGLTLAHPWSDGTRALVFAPVEFLEKLAVLIPKPRINLVVYHGVLAPRARHRAELSAMLASPPADATAEAPAASPPHTIAAVGTPASGGARTPPDASPRSSQRYIAWAELLRRIFAIDVLACTCGGRLRFIATIEDPPVVQRILRHLGLPAATPELVPARPPPSGSELAFDLRW